MKQGEKLERLLFVSRLREPGDEAKVRATAEGDFPRESFEQAGLTGFTVYMGGGWCIFEFGFESPFELIFERVNADPTIREYLDRLGRYVEPSPRIEPGDTAVQPLAADVFMWRRESGAKAREPAGPH
jgi:hypothetical protein